MPPVSTASYRGWAEDYGGNGNHAEGSAHCYLCISEMALHLEGAVFACDLHCRCPNRERAA